MKFIPHEYQEFAIKLLENGNSLLLGMEMGLGKTVVVLTSLLHLFKTERARRVLVVAPKRVAEHVWPEELEKWDHLKTPYTVVKGNPKQRIAALKTDAQIYIISYDNLMWLIALLPARKRDNWPFDTIILDESSKLKNPKSKRFKKLRLIRPHCRRVIELTGSPAPNGLLNFWSQIYLLDMGHRLGNTFGAFRSRYFEQTDFRGYSYAPRPGSHSHIMSKINDVCITMRTRDYLDLPPVKIIPVPVYLPPSTMRAYAELEKEMLTNLESGAVVDASTAAVVSGKCRQITNGGVYHEDDAGKKVWSKTHDIKVDALESIIDENSDKPVLIAYWYKHDLERIRQRFPDVHTLDEPDVINRWNRGEIPLLAAHPASAGHGLNLQAGGHTIVWFAVDWSLELWEQFNARLDRQGQKHSVFIYVILAKDTIDYDILARVEGKRTVQDTIKRILKRSEAS